MVGAPGQASRPPGAVGAQGAAGSRLSSASKDCLAMTRTGHQL